MLTARAIWTTESTVLPVTRAEASTSPGTTTALSIVASRRASTTAIVGSIGPRTRRFTTSDQTWVSQNTATDMTSERAISSLLETWFHSIARRVVTRIEP